MQNSSMCIGFIDSHPGIQGRPDTQLHKSIKTWEKIYRMETNTEDSLERRLAPVRLVQKENLLTNKFP